MKAADANKKACGIRSSTTSTNSLNNTTDSTAQSSSFFATTYNYFKNSSTDGIHLIGRGVDMEVLSETKEQAYQLIIAISSVFSIGSLICLCLVIPSMYNYVDTLETFSKQDFLYCEV